MPLAVVTGASGFVGTHMVDLLAREGYEVRATDVRPPAAPGTAKFIASDITRKETLKPALQGADVLFHIAAVFDYSTPWEVLHRVNVEGTGNVFEVAMDAGVKTVVLWGAVASYGIPDPKRLPVREDHPLTAAEVGYDRSKREQEELAWKMHRENGLPLVVMRPGGIYGPRSRYGLFQLIHSVSQGWLPGIPTNMDYKLPAVHVRDVAGAALHLSRHPAARGQAYNVVDDNILDLRGALQFTAALFGTRISNLPPLPPKMVANFLIKFARGLEKKARKKGVPPKFGAESLQYMRGNYWVSNEKLKSTGYQMLYPDIRMGLAETVTWYQREGLL
ncbi:MAG: NAD-dependent epimerase/dehydratase family protein [Euryarchaeota archaeon]|nr:NAD-dependent epimerase/dehydratase family protein [Euryarchaeota archaeon]